MLGLFVVNVTSSYQLWPNSFQLVARPVGLQSLGAPPKTSNVFL